MKVSERFPCWLGRWRIYLPCRRQGFGPWVRNKETRVWSACSAGDKDLIPGGGNGNPLQFSCLGSPMDYSSWGPRVWHDWVTVTFSHLTLGKHTTQQMAAKVLEWTKLIIITVVNGYGAYYVPGIVINALFKCWFLPVTLCVRACQVTSVVSDSVQPYGV